MQKLASFFSSALPWVLLLALAWLVPSAAAAMYHFTGTGTQTTTTLGGLFLAKKNYAVLVDVSPSLEKPTTIAFRAALKGKKAIIATASNTLTLASTGTAAQASPNPIVFGPAQGRYSHKVVGVNRIFSIDLHQNDLALQYSDHVDLTVSNSNFMIIKRHVQSAAQTIVFDLKFKGKLRGN